MKKKDNYWQIIRGIAILAVIIIHSPTAIEYGKNTIEFDTWMLARQIVSFPVGVFVFLSGYFINIERVEKDRNTYNKRKLSRLWIPFFTWSFIYTLINIKNQWNTLDWESVKIFLWQFITGKSSGPLYYILVLVPLTLLTPLIIHIIKKNNFWAKILWILTPLYLAYLYLLNFYFEYQPLAHNTLFPVWFIFYYLGLYYKIKPDKVVNFSKKVRSLQYLIPLLVMTFIESYGIMTLGGTPGFAAAQLKLSNFAFTLGIIIYIVRIQGERRPGRKENILEKIMMIIGNHSYGIYLSHMIFITLFIQATQKMRLAWIVSFLGCILWTTLGRVAMIKLVKVLGNRLNFEKGIFFYGK